jgi:hypothetical protein
VEYTRTVAESESLSKIIKVDIMFGASSTKYSLLFLKKYPIKKEELLLIEAWNHRGHKNQVWERERERERGRGAAAAAAQKQRFLTKTTWLSPTPLRSSDIRDSTPSSSITKTTVSAASFAKVWTSYNVNSLYNLTDKGAKRMKSRIANSHKVRRKNCCGNVM